MRCSASQRAADAMPSWVNGRLEYLHEELRFVIADVNRYSRRKIQLNDAQVGHLLYTGTVLLEHVDEWVATLPGSFPVRLDSLSGAGSYVFSATPDVAGERAAVGSQPPVASPRGC
jgi:ferric-dicitrate binding protein FerR (iron transport regulator)